MSSFPCRSKTHRSPHLCPLAKLLTWVSQPHSLASPHSAYPKSANLQSSTITNSTYSNPIHRPQITFRKSRTKVKHPPPHLPILKALTCRHHMQRRLRNAIRHDLHRLMRIRMVRAQGNRARATADIYDAHDMRGERQQRREVMHGNRRANSIGREARNELFG